MVERDVGVGPYGRIVRNLNARLNGRLVEVNVIGVLILNERLVGSVGVFLLYGRLRFFCALLYHDA